MVKGLENKFRDNKLLPFLNSLPNSCFFIKEAGNIRGLPDIVGSWYGHAVFLEVKKDATSLKDPRTELQAYWIGKLKRSGAFAEFIYPEIAAEVLDDLAFMMLKSGKIHTDYYKELKELISRAFSF